jgi:hypothetical protein
MFWKMTCTKKNPHIVVTINATGTELLNGNSKNYTGNSRHYYSRNVKVGENVIRSVAKNTKQKRARTVCGDSLCHFAPKKVHIQLFQVFCIFIHEIFSLNTYYYWGHGKLGRCVIQLSKFLNHTLATHNQA